MHDSGYRHFIIAGAQRSGTTLLYRLLDSHPGVSMARPERPEPKFFLRSDALEVGLAGYNRLFPEMELPVRGEKSTSYIESEAAAARIQELLPDVKMVFLLRDPIERAISNYWFSVQHGIEKADMEEAFLKESERRENFDPESFSVSPFAYLQRGRYAEYLEGYRRFFPETQMHLMLFEDLLRDGDGLRRLLDYLGLEDLPQLMVPEEPVNAALRRSGRLDEGLRRYLGEYFAEPNRRLAEDFGLDLSCWTSVGVCS